MTFTYSSAVKPMKVMKTDGKKDLALLMGLSREKTNGPGANLAEYSPNIGDTVWVIGTPLSTKATVTKGIISNFIWEKSSKRLTYRFTAPVFFGNSGGGVFNEKGELIGVSDSITYFRLNMFSVMLVPGANYAVALEEIKKFL